MAVIGRIRVEYCESLSGSTNPSASTSKTQLLHRRPSYQTQRMASSTCPNPATTPTRCNTAASSTGAARPARSPPCACRPASSPRSRCKPWSATCPATPRSASTWATPACCFLERHGGQRQRERQPQSGSLSSTPTGPATARPPRATLDVPIRVTLDRAGQVLLTNLQVTPTGSKTRAIRLPVRPQGYSSVTASFTVSGGTGPLAVGVDVGDDGSVDWTYTGSPAYPASLTHRGQISRPRSTRTWPASRIQPMFPSASTCPRSPR